MPTSSAEAWHQAQILAMRQMAEAQKAQTERLEKLTDKMEEVRDRLIRLEAQETSEAVDQIRGQLAAALTRIDQLESQRDQVKGVAAFSSWASRVGPWFLALAASVWASKETFGK